MVSRSIRSLVLVTDQSRPLIVEGLIAEWHFASRWVSRGPFGPARRGDYPTKTPVVKSVLRPKYAAFGRFSRCNS